MDPKTTMRKRSALEERIVMQARRRRKKIDEVAIVVGMKIFAFMYGWFCEIEGNEREREGKESKDGGENECVWMGKREEVQIIYK